MYILIFDLLNPNPRYRDYCGFCLFLSFCNRNILCGDSQTKKKNQYLFRSRNSIYRNYNCYRYFYNTVQSRTNYLLSLRNHRLSQRQRQPKLLQHHSIQVPTTKLSINNKNHFPSKVQKILINVSIQAPPHLQQPLYQC